jgi:hypothetical protein
MYFGLTLKPSEAKGHKGILINTLNTNPLNNIFWYLVEDSQEGGPKDLHLFAQGVRDKEQYTLYWYPLSDRYVLEHLTCNGYIIEETFADSIEELTLAATTFL